MRHRLASPIALSGMCSKRVCVMKPTTAAVTPEEKVLFGAAVCGVGTNPPPTAGVAIIRRNSLRVMPASCLIRGVPSLFLLVAQALQACLTLTRSAGLQACLTLLQVPRDFLGR
jgi:hypothetical protein